MGVCIYILNEDGEGDNIVSFSYSGVHRLRQMAILSTIEYLESQITTNSQSKQKKLKRSNAENGSENGSESSENSNEDSDDEEMSVETIIEHLKTWCPLKKTSETDSASFSLGNGGFETFVALLQNMIPVNYENVTSTYSSYLERPFVKHNLIGLWKFVKHSDCDGFHSYGDCVDIYELLNKVSPHLQETDDNKEWFKEIVTFFGRAVERKSGVGYS